MGKERSGEQQAQEMVDNLRADLGIDKKETAKASEAEPTIQKAYETLNARPGGGFFGRHINLDRPLTEKERAELMRGVDGAAHRLALDAEQLAMELQDDARIGVGQQAYQRSWSWKDIVRNNLSA
jgi:hypothetical protein